MRIPGKYQHPASVDEAVSIQNELRGLVDATTPPGFQPSTAAGLDIAYEPDSDRFVAAVSVLEIATARAVDSATAFGVARFPYTPGLFAFRELPGLLDALRGLDTVPDVLVCDGQGRAHPRRFGLACHVGVLTGLPTIGVGKTALGAFEPPGPRRGDWTPLIDDGEVVGTALRTRDQVKPVFVSVGHLIDLDTARELVLALTPRYRLPETTRAADHLARQSLTA
jgi:deoxyribonuclease V